MTDVWENLPEDVKGVRIHALQNSKTVLLGIAEPDRQPNRYMFSDKEGVKRVFFSEGARSFRRREDLSRARSLNTGPKGHLTFRGDDISQEQTVLGTLISVAIKIERGRRRLDFALTFPPVHLAVRQSRNSKRSELLIHSRGRVRNPAGAELTYEVIQLKGVAEDIPIL